MRFLESLVNSIERAFSSAFRALDKAVIDDQKSTAISCMKEYRNKQKEYLIDLFKNPETNWVKRVVAFAILGGKNYYPIDNAFEYMRGDIDNNEEELKRRIEQMKRLMANDSRNEAAMLIQYLDEAMGRFENILPRSYF